MSKNTNDDIRGVGRLALTATHQVTEIVEDMHRAIISGPDVLGRPFEVPAQLMTSIVYGTIRRVADVVGSGAGRSLSALEPWVKAGAYSDVSIPPPPGPYHDAVRAAVNGVLGDFLAETQNPLAVTMRLCSRGEPLTLERDALAAALPNAGRRLLVMVHGSCSSDRMWRWNGHDHGVALARDLGYTPVWLRYNSGRHISTNGRQFAGLLEQLVAEWPTEVESLTLLGHSMGGLVARSACHTAEEDGHNWRAALRALVTLGAPHHGAPLERAGSVLYTMLGISKYSAPFKRLARIRSAGITDLRYGYVRDDEWHDRDRFALNPDDRRGVALPADVDCYAIAGSRAKQSSPSMLGDGLVPIKSALGVHRKSKLTLAFPEDNRHVVLPCGHLDLLSNTKVYDTLLSWLSPAELPAS